MTNLFGPMIFVLFSLILLGMAWSELQVAEYAQPEVAGAIIGAVVGTFVLIGGIIGTKRALVSKQATALSSLLFGKFMLEIAGALLIFFGSKFIEGKDGRLFEYRPGLMVFGAVVFLGFALLPKLLQASRNQSENESTSTL